MIQEALAERLNTCNVARPSMLGIAIDVGTRCWKAAFSGTYNLRKGLKSMGAKHSWYLLRFLCYCIYARFDTVQVDIHLLGRKPEDGKEP